MQIKLIKPTLEYDEQIMNYRQIFLDNNDYFAGCGTLESSVSAKDWLDSISLLENPETCPLNFVPSKTFLAIRSSDNKLVGIIDLRHHIDHPVLSVWGGHIGYSIHPDERRKGYAKQMLSLVLLKANRIGINKVLITCDDDNIASEKTILANGGIFENTVLVDNKIVKRYWIEV